jgi:hypothetical protein
MTKPPFLVKFDGGATQNGEVVAVVGELADGAPLGFCIKRDHVSWIIGKLVEWTREAASKAGWKSQPIAQQDDRGIWMRPTQYGLIDADEPDNVHLAIDVGPVRFRFAFERSRAHELGRVLQAASAPQGRAS